LRLTESIVLLAETAREVRLSERSSLSAAVAKTSTAIVISDSQFLSRISNV